MEYNQTFFYKNGSAILHRQYAELAYIISHSGETSILRFKNGESVIVPYEGYVDEIVAGFRQWKREFSPLHPPRYEDGQPECMFTGMRADVLMAPWPDADPLEYCWVTWDIYHKFQVKWDARVVQEWGE